MQIECRNLCFFQSIRMHGTCVEHVEREVSTFDYVDHDDNAVKFTANPRWFLHNASWRDRSESAMS